MILLFIALILLALIMLRVPIAIAIGIIALIGMIEQSGFGAIYDAALKLFEGSTKFPLIAIPLFILAGSLMNTSSISTRLIAFVTALVGFVKGGLAMVNVMVSLFFAEISGSAVADVAAIGSVLIPSMIKKGYNKNFAAAVTSSSASLAIIIPPSIPMILYGAISDTSIIQLFVAGIIPGLIGGFLMMCFCYYYAIKYNLPRDEAFDLKNVWDKFKKAGWALTLPIIILGGIFGGFVTATEGAGLAVLAALLIGGVIYKEINIKHLISSMKEGVIQASAVMLLVSTSALLGLYLTLTEIPQQLAEDITNFTNNKLAIIALLNLLLFVLGMFLHGASAIVLVVPIVMPIVVQAGIDPVHFGIILTLSIALGQQTPPVASVLATACSIAKADMLEVTKSNLPFIMILIVVLLIVSYIPEVPLFLVEMFYRD
jgi:tripartite ATP-independent transporter DctM subunit